MTLTRKQAIAKLAAVEEKHKQDRDSFWLNNVNGDEPWLLEIRKGLTRKEIKGPREISHSQKDLTKENLIWEMKQFRTPSVIARKYHFKSFKDIEKLAKEYGLKELYDDCRVKRHWVVVEDPRKRTVSIETVTSLAQKIGVHGSILNEIIKSGEIKGKKLTKYPEWIKKKREKHENMCK